MTNEEKAKLKDMLGKLDTLREQIRDADAKAKALMGELDAFIEEGVGTAQTVGNRPQ